eukprot:6561606-Pyramimonas_sp.AAC.1
MHKGVPTSRSHGGDLYSVHVLWGKSGIVSRGVANPGKAVSQTLNESSGRDSSIEMRQTGRLSEVTNEGLYLQ